MHTIPKGMRRSKTPRCKNCRARVAASRIDYCRRCYRASPIKRYVIRILARPLERGEIVGALDGDTNNDKPGNVFVQRGNRRFVLDCRGRGQNWRYTRLAYRISYVEIAKRTGLHTSTICRAVQRAKNEPAT